MKKFPLWVTATPIILISTVFQLTTDLAEQGKLNSAFLRNDLNPFASKINGAMLNSKFNLRGPRPVDKKIVVVAVDEYAISALGRWPWEREVMSEVIDAIFDLGAKNLGIDIAFSEREKRVPEAAYKIDGISERIKTSLRELEGDPKLARVIAKHRDHLVLGYGASGQCQPKYEPDCAALIDNETKFTQSQLDEFDQTANFDTDAPGEVAQKLNGFELETRYPFTNDIFKKTPLKFLADVFASTPGLKKYAKHSGYFIAEPDSDGYIRRYPLFGFNQGKIYPSLALEMAQLARDDQLKIDFSEDGLVKKAWFSKAPDSPVPLTPLGYLNINFKAAPAEQERDNPNWTGVSSPNSYSYISVTELFEKPLDSLPTDDARFKERARMAQIRDMMKNANVYLGVTALGLYDMRAFPFSSNTPGVEGHATVLDNLLHDDALRSVSGTSFKWVPILILILTGVGLAMLFSKLESIPSVMIFFGTIAGLGFVDQKLIFSNQIQVSTAFLLIELILIFLLILSIRFIQEEQNKKFVKEAFSKYLAPQVVDLVLEDPEKLTVGGERKDVTILFSDLRGFTNFSENMDPKILTQFLNEYLSEMTEIIFQYEGTLDKYIGDAIMAFWGAPLEQKDHVERAWNCAVAMRKRLAEIAPDFKARYGIEVSAGIGINSGVVSVGNMGSKRIFEYTVIGDHVNLASRLESLTRLYGGDILSTQTTKDKLPPSVQSQFHTRTLDAVIVKGKTQAVELIQISETPYDSELITKFNAARDAFRRRDWGSARILFAEASAVEKRRMGEPDPVSEIYITRCDEYESDPPPADWDGTIEMRKK